MENDSNLLEVYALKLISSGDEENKIALLREIRSIKNCDLQTGKSIIEKTNSIIIYVAEESSAIELKQILEKYGATIEIVKVLTSKPLYELNTSNQNTQPENEQKSFVTTTLLALFLGVFGAHRFYTGYIGIGIAQLLTFGGFGLWAIIDIFSICFNKFKDVKNRELKGYNTTLSVVAIVLMGLFIVAIALSDDSEVSDTDKPKEAQETPVEQVEQEEVKTNETQNGIAFNVLSKQFIHGYDLIMFGLTETGDYPVLLINLEIKNNGNKPFDVDINAQLADENGVTYAGNKIINPADILNSTDDILNPGMSKTEMLYFKVPEMKEYTIELQDGTFFSDTVSIKL